MHRLRLLATAIAMVLVALAVFLLWNAPGAARPSTGYAPEDRNGVTPADADQEAAQAGEPRHELEVTGGVDATATTGLWLRDATDGSCIAGVVVQCLGSDGPCVRRSDENGRIVLPPGRWSLDAEAAGYGPRCEQVVGQEPDVVWWTRAVALVVEVTADNGRGLGDALVSLRRYAETLLADRPTDANGAADLGRCWIRPGMRVAATAPGYLPREVEVDPAALRPTLRIRMEACSESWTLCLRDAKGMPLGGASVTVVGNEPGSAKVALGMTGEDGLLPATGNWMFGPFTWSFGGAAFPFRIAAPTWSAELAETRRVEVVGPRPCSGTLSVQGFEFSQLEWQVLEPRSNPSGSGLLFQVHQQQEPGVLTLTLPEQWPTRLVGKWRGLTLHDEVLVVAGSGWARAVVVERPTNLRRLHLRSASSPIQAVQLGEHVLFPGGGADLLPQPQVDVELPRERATLQVEFASGVRHLLLAPPGVEDAVLDLEPEQAVEAAVMLVDANGDPVRDVVVRLSRRTLSSPTDLPGTGWQYIVAGNVHHLPAAEHGAARCRLLPGDYAVEIEHLRLRNSLGMSWSPLGARLIRVPPSGAANVTLVTPRPRLVRVVLENAAYRLPAAWQLSVGPYSASFGGSSCSVWLTEQAQQLTVRSASGAELATAMVPAGPGPTVVVVRL